MKDQELEKGFNLTIENAKSLIEEGKILKANGYYARAYTLNQLALEEAGKATLIYVAILNYYQGVSIDDNYFKTQKFYDHERKTKAALSEFLIVINRYEKSTNNKMKALKNAITKYENDTTLLNNAKNNSLYVFIESDSFQNPVTFISEKNVSDIEFMAVCIVESVSLILEPLDKMKSAALNIIEIENASTS